MVIAVLTTAALIVQLAGGNALGLGWVLLGLLVGGTAGAVMAQRVEMTKMPELVADRKSTRLNSSHSQISYAVFCLKKKKQTGPSHRPHAPDLPRPQQPVVHRALRAAVPALRLDCRSRQAPAPTPPTYAPRDVARPA